MSLNSEVKKLSSQTYRRYIQGKKSVRKQSRENRREVKLDFTGQSKTSKDKPAYSVQSAESTSSSGTVASCPPNHATRDRFLASARSHIELDTQRTKSSCSGARFLKNQRPKQSDTIQDTTMEYKVVTMNETEKDRSTRNTMLQDVKKQNWIKDGETRVNSAYVTPKNKLGLIQRNYSLCADSAEQRIQERPLRVSFKTTNHFCDRAFRLENGDFSKQFCDIFGPGMCTDCTKARRQYISIEDHVQSYPRVAVSPYILCVHKEDASGKASASTDFRDCDALARSLSRASRGDTPETFRFTTKARPNSCNDERTASTMPDLRNGGPYPVNDSSEDSVESSESPYSSGSSSRRSSISKNADTKQNTTQLQSDNLSSPGGNNHRDFDPTPVLSTPNQFSSPSPPARGNPHVENRRQSTSRLTSRRSRLIKTPVIERTGKLRELPYWRFLIPEPPTMEVRRMNVSIFTPKEIPGIKIFDESFFEL